MFPEHAGHLIRPESPDYFIKTNDVHLQQLVALSTISTRTISTDQKTQLQWHRNWQKLNLVYIEFSLSWNGWNNMLEISNKMMGDKEWYFTILTISQFSLAYIRISGRQ
jgi:hypothetical protein